MIKYVFLLLFISYEIEVLAYLYSADLKNAFMNFTKNADHLEKIIMEMYQKLDSTPSIQFQVPNENNSGYTMLLMKRSNLSQPIFPNVTTMTQINMMIQKQRYLSKKDNINADINDWGIFGLDGWIGEISPALTVKISETITNNDLTSNYIKDNETELQEKNIFIARANNPFGYSTMWQIKDSNVNDIIDRKKRDVIKLYSMIKCSTGCNPLSYKPYGCFCGFLGAGEPVNGIDRCCQLHDRCYERSNCISYLEYFVPYLWKCHRGKPLCAINHGEWGGPNSCAARLCYCDLRLSKCLKKYSCPSRKATCKSPTPRQIQSLFLLK